MSSRSLLLALAAATSASLAPAVSQAQTAVPARRSIELQEPSATVCREGRSARARQQAALCVIGVATDPTGVARVLLNGQPLALRVDSAGAAHFVGYAPPDTGQTRIEVTMEGKGGGEALVQRYALTPDRAASPGGDVTAYTVLNLTPRVLGGSPSTVAQAAPAPQQTPAPQAQVAAQTAASPGAVSASGSAAAPADLPAPMPAVQVQASTATPAAAAADASGPSAVEDAQTYLRVLEPAEWSGLSTRGIQITPRSSLRITGIAQHASGVARVEVNGARASITPDPSGGQHFVAYVPADPARRDVELVVRGFSGPPLVKHFEVQPAPAAAALPVAGAGDRTRAAGGRFKGRRWAVVVGVSQYADHGITALRYADADAKAFYDFLRSPRAGIGGFPDENIKLLLNEHATYREIRSALFTFLKGATDDDEVVVYFAGHGAPDPQRLQNLYLLTYDTDLADISGTAFPMDDVSKAIHSLYAHDIVVITDACHSGGIGGQQVATRDLGANAINDSFLQALSGSTGGLAIFTASGANQLSQEDARWGGGHGVFTHYLLEGLDGKADEDADHVVTLTEMMEYARAHVRQDTRNAQIPTISQTTYDPYLPMSVVLDSAAQAAVLAAAPPAAGPGSPVAASRDASSPVPSAADAGLTPQQSAAIEAARATVRDYPNSGKYRGALGLLLRAAGRTDEAVAALQEAVRLDPQNADLLYELGVTLRTAGMHPQAAAQFEAATRLDARSGIYFDALGNELLAQGQTDEALDRLRRAVGLQRDNAAFHRDLGVALGKANRPGDAVNELRQAVLADTRNGGYHVELAQALDAAGRADEALVEYHDATTVDAVNAGFHAAYARALRVAGRGTEAVGEMKAAVAREPRSAAYHHDLGLLLRDQSMPAEALQEFTEAARLQPDSAVMRYELGVALAGTTRRADAVAELKQAVRLRPGNAAYQDALGTALNAAGNPTEAMAAFRAAIAAAPNEARYHYDLALVLRDAGLLPDAVTELDTAVRLDGHNRDYRTALSSLRSRVH